MTDVIDLTGPEWANELSPDQVDAIERIEDWLLNDRAKQTMTLAGYAGTGKTTVVSQLLDRIGNDHVLVATPTGKAAARLRELGVHAMTIHKMAYTFVGEDEKGPLFEYSGIKEAPKLVVVDEASMVNQVIYNDLLSGGYRMLFVGDHGQLAPVGRDPGLMKHPDVVLTQIHRQDDKGLLDFAHELRSGVPAARIKAEGAARYMHWRAHQEEAGRALSEADIVLCHKNETRWWLNHRLLQTHGYIPRDFGYVPNNADNLRDTVRQLIGQTFPVICSRNNYAHNVFNGQVYDFRLEWFDGYSLGGYLQTDDGDRYASLDIEAFHAEPGKLIQPKGHLLFDFGLCITAHKAQGSEWPHVVVWDDVSNGWMPDLARWGYTAATRAKDRLTWIA